jgi:uncharacterized membrane protein
MSRPLVAYGAALLALGVLDFIWLRVIAMQWYESGMGHLMAAKPNLVGAAAFYFLYPVGLVVFAVHPAQGDIARALGLGALFGLFCYATFDLTSLAVLRDFPAWLAALDIAWGASVSAVGALAGVLAWRAVNG